MIKIILQVASSNRDMYGNCYHYCIVTRTCDGATLSGTVDADSNPVGCLRNAGFAWAELSDNRNEIPIREYNRLTKASARITAEEIVTFAKREVA